MASRPLPRIGFAANDDYEPVPPAPSAFVGKKINPRRRQAITQLVAEQIANLLNTAGFAIGIGEWRPERNGSYGRFHVGGEADQ